MKAKTLVIAVTGTMTSGKGAVRYFLVNKGFKSIRLTRPILKEGLERDLDMSDRQNWLDIVVEMRKKKGLDVLAKIASEKIKDEERYVVCPPRHPADLEYLKEKYDAIVIFVDSPFDSRYRRTFLKELGSGMSLETFRQKDEFEKNPTGKDKKYLPNISKCRELADVIIDNKGSLNELNMEVEKFLRKNNITELQDTGVYDDFDI